MGVVLRAFDPALRRPVAIKVIAGALDPIGRHAERFVREARAAARLRHPGIVAVHEVGAHAGRPFIVLDWVDGESLDRVLARGRLAPRRAATIVRDLARALAHAHGAGILHRDVKPQNVLIDRGGAVRLGDFGLARDLTAIDQATLTAPGQLVGTPEYVAPEQARGDPDVGPAADVWGAGAVLYRALLGRSPFPGETVLEVLDRVFTAEPERPRRLDRTIPRDLETIALRCLDKRPERRYASAEALADDLDRHLAGEPIAARPIGRLERVARWARRDRAFAATVAIGLLLALALVGGGAGAGVYAWLEVRRALDEARAARADAEREEATAAAALARARAAEADARTEADRARAARSAAAERVARILTERAGRAAARGESPTAWVLAAAALELAPSPEARLQLLDARSRSPRLRWASPASLQNSAMAVALDGPDLAVVVAREIRRWDLATGLERPSLPPREGAALSSWPIAVSPDGRQLAAATSDSERLTIVDLRSAEDVLEIELDDVRVSSVALREGRLAGAARDGRIWLWNAETGDPVARHETGSPCVAVAIAPGGDTLAAASGRSIVLIPPGGPVDPIAAFPDQTVSALAFSSDGRRVVAGGHLGGVLEIELATGRALRTLQGAAGKAIQVVAFADQRIVAGGEDYHVTVWDAAGTARRFPLASAHRHFPIAVAPDGRLVASSAPDRGVRVLDAATGETRAQLVGHPYVKRAVVSPDGRTLASVGMAREIRLWNARTGAALGSPPGELGSGDDLAWLPDGRLLVADGGRLLAQRIPADPDAAWTEPETLLDAPAPSAASAGDSTAPGLHLAAIDVSRDGETIALATRYYRAAGEQTRGCVRLFDLASRTLGPIIGDHRKPPLSISLQPGGRLMATANGGGRLQVHDVETGARHRGPPDEITDRVNGAAFSPDGRLLAWESEEHVHVWDVEVGRAVAALPVPGDYRKAAEIAWSADGRLLAAGGLEALVSVWHLARAELVTTIRAHATRITSIAFGPGASLVTTSNDHDIRVWDVPESLAPPGPIAQHERGKGVATLTVDPTGRRVASTDLDGTIRSTDLAGDDPPTILRRDGLTASALLLDGRVRAVHEDGDVLERRPGEDRFRVLAEGSGPTSLSPDGRRALRWGERGGEVAVVDLATGDRQVLADEASRVRATAWSSDGSRLVVAWSSGLVVFDAGRGDRLVETDPGRLDVLALSPDGRTIAVGRSRAVRLITFESDGSSRARDLAANGYMAGLAFDGSGALVAAATSEEVAIWSVATGERRLTIPLRGQSRPRPVAFANERLLVGWSDGAVTVHALEGIDRTDAELIAEAERSTGLRVEGATVRPAPGRRLIITAPPTDRRAPR